MTTPDERRAFEVSMNCDHGRWLGADQFGACLPCITAALAAQRERFSKAVCFGCSEEWPLTPSGESHIIPLEDREPMFGDASIWYDPCRVATIRAGEGSDG